MVWERLSSAFDDKRKLRLREAKSSSQDPTVISSWPRRWAWIFSVLKTFLLSIRWGLQSGNIQRTFSALGRSCWLSNPTRSTQTTARTRKGNEKRYDIWEAVWCCPGTRVYIPSGPHIGRDLKQVTSPLTARFLIWKAMGFRWTPGARPHMPHSLEERPEIEIPPWRSGRCHPISRSQVPTLNFSSLSSGLFCSLPLPLSFRPGEAPSCSLHPPLHPPGALVHPVERARQRRLRSTFFVGLRSLKNLIGLAPCLWSPGGSRRRNTVLNQLVWIKSRRWS